MTFDVTIEREINGDGETELTDYENVSKAINIPSYGKDQAHLPRW
jgi:hypothetical protein